MTYSHLDRACTAASILTSVYLVYSLGYHGMQMTWIGVALASGAWHIADQIGKLSMSLLVASCITLLISLVARAVFTLRLTIAAIAILSLPSFPFLAIVLYLAATLLIIAIPFLFSKRFRDEDCRQEIRVLPFLMFFAHLPSFVLAFFCCS